MTPLETAYFLIVKVLYNLSHEPGEARGEHFKWCTPRQVLRNETLCLKLESGLGAPGVYMKQAMVFVAAAVLGSALVMVAMMFAGQPRPFKEMPGLYRCENFGVPDANYNRLRITEDMTLVGMAGEKTFNIGRLAPRDQGAELEYSMEMVHFPSFNLDPFTPPRLYVYKSSLEFTAKEKEKTFTVTCERMAD